MNSVLSQIKKDVATEEDITFKSAEHTTRVIDALEDGEIDE